MVCSICKGRKYLFDPATRRCSPCECLGQAKLAQFLGSLPSSNPIPSPAFERLDPLKRSFLLTGDFPTTYGVIRHFLTQNPVQFLHADPSNLAASFSGDDEAVKLKNLVYADLLIISMSCTLYSEKVGQVVFYIWSERYKLGKPTWFVAHAVDHMLRASYKGPLLDLVTGKDVLGTSIREVKISSLISLGLRPEELNKHVDQVISTLQSENISEETRAGILQTPQVAARVAKGGFVPNEPKEKIYGGSSPRPTKRYGR